MISFSPVELVVRLVQNLKSVGITVCLGLALGFHASTPCQGQESTLPGPFSSPQAPADPLPQLGFADAPEKSPAERSAFGQNKFGESGNTIDRAAANPFTNFFSSAYENKLGSPQESHNQFEQSKNSPAGRVANAGNSQPFVPPKTSVDLVEPSLDTVKPNEITNAFAGAFAGAYEARPSHFRQNSSQLEPAQLRLTNATTSTKPNNLQIPGWSAEPMPVQQRNTSEDSGPIPALNEPVHDLAMDTNQFQAADFEPPSFTPMALPGFTNESPMKNTPAENILVANVPADNFLFEGEPTADTPAIQTAPVQLLWWKKLISTPTRSGGSSVQIETNGLVYMALARSPRIRALSQTPLIREQQVTEAQSAFDPVSFIQSQFQDRVDPVGDQLSVTNDGSDFLEDHIWTADLGVRKKTETGASVELNQRIGFRNSNSQFFSPQDQGTATLALNVTQPLMRGRGRYYNRSQILIAQSAGSAAWNTFVSELQDEVQSTVEAYWRLYFDRSVFLQKQRNVERAQIILAKLEGRASLDSLPSQIARARSAVLSRRTELANANRDIRNSETEIRRLTADTDWRSSQMIEMLPAELPISSGPEIGLEQVIVTALENRPEIRETLQRSKIAAVQRDISVNDLMPELSLLLGTYVSALDGESQLGDAWADQYSTKPGYSVGVEFELPIGNRAARSRLTQRKLQLNKIKSEVDETMQNVIAESQIALRRVSSARETLVAATEAILAAQLDLEQNKGRWEAFALVEGDIVEGQTPTTVLDQLLDSQERLSAAELVFAQAELELKTSETALQRTMGTLLVQRSVNFNKSTDGCLPVVNFSQR